METKISAIEQKQATQADALQEMHKTIEQELHLPENVPSNRLRSNLATSSRSSVSGKTPRFRSSRRAAAEEGLPPPMRFEDVDADGDGQITRDEWEAAAAKRTAT